MQRARIVLSLVWLVSVTACGGAGDEPAADAASTPGVDAAPPDAAGPDAPPPPTGCLIKVVATSPECHADCDAHLFLPSGSRWCTVACGGDPDCTPYGAELTCAAEVGTCMPRCTTDAGCQAQGFPRCHPLGSFCDTLPPCQNDQQCVDNGLTKCVMPGNYCT